MRASGFKNQHGNQQTNSNQWVTLGHKTNWTHPNSLRLRPRFPHVQPFLPPRTHGEVQGNQVRGEETRNETSFPLKRHVSSTRSHADGTHSIGNVVTAENVSRSTTIKKKKISSSSTPSGRKKIWDEERTHRAKSCGYGRILNVELYRAVRLFQYQPSERQRQSGCILSTHPATAFLLLCHSSLHAGPDRPPGRRGALSHVGRPNSAKTFSLLLGSLLAGASAGKGL